MLSALHDEQSALFATRQQREREQHTLAVTHDDTVRPLADAADAAFAAVTAKLTAAEHQRQQWHLTQANSMSTLARELPDTPSPRCPMHTLARTHARYRRAVPYTRW